MSNEQTELLHINALYTVAEDISRFAPWEDGIAPFVLIDSSHPEAYVLVVIEDDGEGTSDIRLVLGACGVRAWMVEQDDSSSEEDELSVETFVNRYEGYYLEVGYNMPNLNNFEKRLLDGYEQRITFRRQRPGYGLATIVDNRDYAHMERYLRAILQLLTQQKLGSAVNDVYRLQMHGPKDMLRAAAFTIDDGAVVPAEPFVMTLDQWLEHSAPVIDEFTRARVKHMRSDGRMYELFYFYLPQMVSAKGALPKAFFLVDLETGFLEWNDVIVSESGWQEKLLRQLWDFFLNQGVRPHELLIQNINTYCSLAEDIAGCGVRPVYIEHSYVGQELLDSYLHATHIKQHQMMDDHFPRDPY